MAGSKNNIENKGKKMVGKFALSSDCENCKDKCAKGEKYLKNFGIKLQGNGVWCLKI